MKKSLIFLIHGILVFFVLSACQGSASDEGNAEVTYLTVTADGGNEKLVGKTFVFKVKDNLTNDVTSQSLIYINNQMISGNTFTPTEKGSYTVRAEYRDLPINPISVKAVVSSGISFKHRILYEDFTGTWCGYCTIALARHDNLAHQTEDFVFIGIHGPAGTTDPWSNDTGTEMETLKNVTEWPAMFINRNTVWPYDSNYTDMSLPLGQLSAFSKIGIKMKTSGSGNTFTTEASVLFTEDFTHLKIAAFLVEDGLVHHQKNYISSLYGGSSYIYNYVHHNVLRSKLTSSVTGENIPNTQTATSSEYIRAFQYTVPAGYNADKLKIIIMITDSNGTVLNVREEKINTNNTYEFL
ncbi:Omp28-related outer membrane protein [Chryseobacterium sp. L7]|uniref:Omp28-related outer membrane protein n=1 Tax=Chryseobacterium endalhagicum TaxID=2797638 RepID=A0ABS1QAK6_9FLAO|nr:Omp28-related outer membrane protein [Chryseobacterium endalhagicum]MBL1219649.1 Omp28-related outer membrane protein [Chryseobacterium endalhagicum]